MAITYSATSLKRLEGVHPDLRRVFMRYAKDAAPEDDIIIIQGTRTKEEMWVNYGKGRTVAQCAAKGVPAKYAKPTEPKVTWLNDPLMSNHRIHSDGFGHAVDAAPYPIDWNNLARFRRMVVGIKAAAKAEGVAIVSGADWTKPDLPHTELA